jgi:hypothetical protein
MPVRAVVWCVVHFVSANTCRSNVKFIFCNSIGETERQRYEATKAVVKFAFSTFYLPSSLSRR